MKRIVLVVLVLGILLTACSASNRQPGLSEEEGNPIPYLINENGKTLQERIMVPKDFERIPMEEGSFGEYLRRLPLKPHGSKVKFYDGRTKSNNVYEAVLDMDIGDRDLQQCADAAIRLRAEYLYAQQQYDKIHFNFTNGFKADYTSWMEGKRIKVEGNQVSWVTQSTYSNDYASFRKYLDMVFAYAGTLSLSQEMQKVPLEDMQPGDIFIEGGSPGHCVIVVDMAQNMTTGEIRFLLAQSYMPAQEIHILKNPKNGNGNPWYSLEIDETLETPEWKFEGTPLAGFGD